MKLMPPADDASLLKQAARQYPQIAEVLTRLRTAELENMANTTPEQFSTYKGRVQCLTELRQLFRSPTTP